MASSPSPHVPLTLAPPDCVVHALSYLPLTDVLRYSASSARSARDAARDLARRRKRMRMMPPPSTSPPRGGQGALSRPPLRHAFPPIPPAAERLRMLARSMPRSHRLRDAVRTLADDLLAANDDGAAADGEGGAGEALAKLRRAGSAHRAHAAILKLALERIRVRDDDEAVVPLERYVGDVMCVRTLMGNYAAGLVEGGPAQDEVHILREVLEEGVCRRDATASEWYRAWVLLHGCALRTAPFTSGQRAALRIEEEGSEGNMIGSGEGDGWDSFEGRVALPLVPPHPALRGCGKGDALRSLSRLGREATLKIRHNDFGPLGPTFRGRDLVRSRVAYPLTLLAPIAAFDGMPDSVYEVNSDDMEESLSNVYLRRWREETDESVKFLLDTHREAFKARPMTVEPPVVHVKMVN